MDKLLLYESNPDRDGEPLIWPVSGQFDKVASSVHPNLLHALAEMDDPEGDMARTIITALSAYDTFGPNGNGDGFYRDDLLHVDSYPKDGESITVPMYETFEHFAKPYWLHMNKPHMQSYGNVRRAVWNGDMDRVELIVDVDEKLAPKIVKKIRNYEPVSTSMGFKATYDTCSVCGNKAANRGEYCNHLKRNMLSVMPDGHIVHARNPKGYFFDISFVIDPADATSRAVAAGRLPSYSGSSRMAKAASLRGKPAQVEGVYLSSDLADTFTNKEAQTVSREKVEKRAADKSAGDKAGGYEATGKNKRSDIDKEVPATVEMRPDEVERQKNIMRRMLAARPEMAEEELQKISYYPFPKIAATLAMAGISLTPKEAQYVALASNGFPKSAQRFYRANLTFEPRTVVHNKVGSQDVSRHLLSTLRKEGLLEKCSMYMGHINRRIPGDAMGLDGFSDLPEHENPYMDTHYSNIAIGASQLRPEELEAMEERAAIGRSYEKGIMEYLLGLFIGSEWARDRQDFEGRIADDPEVLASIIGEDMPPPSRRHAPEHEVMGQSLMDTPMVYAMNGGEPMGTIYKEAGTLPFILRSMVSREKIAHAILSPSAFNKEAMVVCR